MRCATWAVAAVTVTMLTAACDRPGTPQRAGASAIDATDQVSLSPAETARRICALHNARDYAGLSALLDPQTADETLAFLRSADAVIDAHNRLQVAAEARYGKRIHHAWNIDAMANNLGPFSRDIRILKQSFEGRTATVTLQAGDNVPLVRADFIRADRGWRLRESLSSRPLIDPLDRFARRIDDVARRVREGLSPIGYFDAVTQELMPQLLAITGGDTLDEPRRFTDAAEPE